MRDVTGNWRDARELAAHIEKYWHDKGYGNVRVWVEKVHSFNTLHAHYAIRSNIRFRPL